MSLCAICDDTHSTLRLCESCKADPSNVDWRSASSREELGTEQDAGSNEGMRVRASLQDCQESRPRTPTETQQQIVNLLIVGATTESYQYRDRSKRARGTRLRWRGLTPSEIARLVGCHVNYVLRVRKRLLHANVANAV